MLKLKQVAAVAAVSALIGAAFSSPVLADPVTDITNSMNQVSLSYLTTSPSNSRVSDYHGAQAQVSYLGDAFYKAAYVSASVSEATSNVHDTLNVNDYNYDARVGKGYMVTQTVALVPYAHLGHEVLSAGFDTSAADSYGVGAEALYSPMTRLVLSANLAADHYTGDVSGAVGTPDGLVTAESVGVDYALTSKVHLSAGYGRRAFSVGGSSATDKVATVGVGLGF